MNPDIERLDGMLNRLKLTAIRDRLDALAEEASRQDNLLKLFSSRQKISRSASPADKGGGRWRPRRQGSP